MSRVLHCLSTLQVGGVERRVLGMLQQVAERGSRHEHVLCAFRGGPLEQDELARLRGSAVGVYVLDRPARFSLGFAKALRRTVEHVQPDIIQAYNPGAALWTRVLLPRGSRRRVVVHCGGVGVFRSLRGRLMERALLRRTDAYVFNSHSTQAVWKHYLPIHGPHRVVYNGLAASEPAEPLPILPSEPFVLLTVCRIMPVKSLTTQLQALALLPASGRGELQLIIVGDGPDRASVQREAARLGLERFVRFEGYQSDPRPYRRRAHVYLCTSYNETFGLTITEAMGDGLVCLAARAGGPSEIIEDGVNGYLLPCTVPPPAPLRRALPPTVYDHVTGQLRPPLGVDPQALADKIAEVRTHYGTLVPLREAARRTIAERFSRDRYLAELEDLYDSLA